MPRDDENFWGDVFRKSPVIASFMVLGGIAGAIVGIYYFGEAAQPGTRRIVSCMVVTAAFVGIGVGLVVGVIFDSFLGILLGIFRSNGKKKPPPKKRPRRRIVDDY